MLLTSPTLSRKHEAGEGSFCGNAMTENEEEIVRDHIWRELAFKWCEKDLAAQPIQSGDVTSMRQQLTNAAIREQKKWCEVINRYPELWTDGTATRLENEVFAEFWRIRTLDRQVEK